MRKKPGFLTDRPHQEMPWQMLIRSLCGNHPYEGPKTENLHHYIINLAPMHYLRDEGKRDSATSLNQACDDTSRDL